MSDTNSDTITMADLRAATRGPSDLHRSDQEVRYINTYWLLPGTIPDASGHSQAAKLTIKYDKGRRYTAELGLASIQIHGGHGSYSESFNIGVTNGVRAIVLTEPVTRFNRAKFDQFVQLAYRAAAQDEPAALDDIVKEPQ